MSSDVIRLEISRGVARITMARPEKHNTFDDVLIAD
jgi:enoyl-CoA hydratase/carnithine racemase